MPRLTIRLPDDQHQRLQLLASRRGISLNKLFQQLSTRALVETDAETRFRPRATRDDAAAELAVLDKLARHFAGNGSAPATAPQTAPTA